MYSIYILNIKNEEKTFLLVIINILYSSEPTEDSKSGKQTAIPNHGKLYCFATFGYKTLQTYLQRAICHILFQRRVLCSGTFIEHSHLRLSVSVPSSSAISTNAPIPLSHSLLAQMYANRKGGPMSPAGDRLQLSLSMHHLISSSL